jgi:hypothetical protein
MPGSPSQASSAATFMSLTKEGDGATMGHFWGAGRMAQSVNVRAKPQYLRIKLGRPDNYQHLIRI